MSDFPQCVRHHTLVRKFHTIDERIKNQIVAGRMEHFEKVLSFLETANAFDLQEYISLYASVSAPVQ